MKRLYLHPVRYKCNKNCNFCITKQQMLEKSKYPEFIDLELIKKNKEFILTFDEIEITGGGEPSLHPEFIKILTYLYNIKIEYKKDIKIKLYTNGYLDYCYFYNLINEVTLSSTVNNILNNDEKLFYFNKTMNYYNKIGYLLKNKAKFRLRLYTENDEFLLNNLNIIKEKLKLNNFCNNFSKIIFGLDFNCNKNLKNIENIKNNLSDKFHIDLNENKCIDKPILYTDGIIYDSWDVILQEKNKCLSYHNMEIKKGSYGNFSKISEEFYELQDAINQDNKLLILMELSDLLGSIEGYMVKNYNDISFNDLLQMKNLTKRVFENGYR